MNDTQKLRLMLSEIYESRGDAIRVSAAWIATEAMQSIDPNRVAPDLVYLAAHLQLRQLARAIFRQRFEEQSPETEQHNLFPDLQHRYPAAHARDADPEYVLLEHLTERDVKFNLARLRATGLAVLRHADALEAWWNSRPEQAA